MYGLKRSKNDKMFEKLTYILFYITGIVALLAAILTNNLVIYFKPAVVVALSILYLANAKYKSYLVVLSLLLILVCETLFLYDYIGNFKILHILLSIYYALNIVLLSKSLQVIKVRFDKIFTLQMLISMALILYVLVSVAKLILPQVSDHAVVLIILIFFFALFIGVCYYIYLNSRTIISYSLMIAASCFLIVNIINALNGLYISLAIFPVITTILQIVGQYFLIKFFLEQYKLTPNSEDYF